MGGRTETRHTEKDKKQRNGEKTKRGGSLREKEKTRKRERTENTITTTLDGNTPKKTGIPKPWDKTQNEKMHHKTRRTSKKNRKGDRGIPAATEPPKSEEDQILMKKAEQRQSTKTTDSQTSRKRKENHRPKKNTMGKQRKQKGDYGRMENKTKRWKLPSYPKKMNEKRTEETLPDNTKMTPQNKGGNGQNLKNSQPEAENRP